ncbi:unnamed protein product [Cunninghamella blakesleeana]
MKAIDLFQIHEITLNLIKYIDNWDDLEQFAMINAAICNQFISAPINLPLITNLQLKEMKILQLKTATILIIKPTSYSNSITSLIRSISIMKHLKEINIEVKISDRQIKIVKNIIKFKPNITLRVPYPFIDTYYKKLCFYNKHKIILTPLYDKEVLNDMYSSNDDEGSNSSENEINDGDKHDDIILPRKRLNHEMYDTPELIRVRVEEYKYMLKLPAIKSGLAIPKNITPGSSISNSFSTGLLNVLAYDFNDANDIKYHQENEGFKFLSSSSTFSENEKKVFELVEYYATNIETKKEQRAEWKEITIQWGQIQFLAIGGYFGNILDSTAVPFLGSALNKNISLKNDEYTLLTPFFPQNYQSTQRYLRNYTKRHSKLYWSFFSTSIYRNQFLPCHPLFYDNHSARRNAKPNIASLCSFILRCICYGEVKRNDLLSIKKLLMDAPKFTKIVKTEELITTGTTFFNNTIQFLLQHNQATSSFYKPIQILANWESALNEKNINTMIIIPDENLKEESLNFYKKYLAKQIKIINNNHLKNYTKDS